MALLACSLFLALIVIVLDVGSILHSSAFLGVWDDYQGAENATLPRLIPLLSASEQPPQTIAKLPSLLGKGVFVRS